MNWLPTGNPDHTTVKPQSYQSVKPKILMHWKCKTEIKGVSHHADQTYILSICKECGERFVEKIDGKWTKKQLLNNK